jgi:hypothetical protein
VRHVHVQCSTWKSTFVRMPTTLRSETFVVINALLYTTGETTDAVKDPKLVQWPQQFSRRSSPALRG